MSQGNMQVILCERGIRTYETATRNTFDVAAIPVLKRETHLPVVADPSHAGGYRHLVTPLALAVFWERRQPRRDRGRVPWTSITTVPPLA